MVPTAEQLATEVTKQACNSLDENIARIRHCVGQLSDEQLSWRPRPEMNSIGNLMLHVAGNVHQWIVAGIGGAPDDRDRPHEFSERGPLPKAPLLAALENVVDDVKTALSRASAEHLLAPRSIQGNVISGLAAIFGSVPHFQGHTQEIISLTRMQLGDVYKFYWTPKA